MEIYDLIRVLRAEALDSLHKKDRWGITNEDINEEMQLLIRENNYGKAVRE